MRIELYKKEHKHIWDDFVRNSKNGTFLFYRDFIEYHGNRFKDHSLMFYEGDSLVGVMPAHIQERCFYTHNGLTYGGLIMGESSTAVVVLGIFEYLVFTLRQQGFERIVYKAVPHIYHKSPAEEDLYALFRQNATLAGRSIASSFLLSEDPVYSDSRKRGLKKAQKNKLVFEKSDQIADFWKILEENISERYNVHPVHSLKEISYLKKTFPKNIYLYLVKDFNNEILAGCLVFETDTVVHAQYVSSTDKGRLTGAVDMLINEVLKFYKKGNLKYFDYGISTENSGLYLNNNLIYQKEGFGFRGIIYDKYEINLKL